MQYADTKHINRALIWCGKTVWHELMQKKKTQQYIVQTGTPKTRIDTKLGTYTHHFLQQRNSLLP